MQLPPFGQFQPFGRGRGPVRPGQGILNGDHHVRHPQLGQDGPVLVLDQRMDDAFPMDHDLNLVGRHVKQPPGLDQFQPLVHHGGGIDGDFGPHIPVGMAQSLRRGYGLELCRRFSVKRAARSGQNQPAETLFGLS